MIFHSNELSRLIERNEYSKLFLYVSLGFDLTLSDVNHDYVAKYGNATNKAFDYSISNNLSSLKKISRKYLDSVNENGYSPLHWAIISNNNEIVKYLIDLNVNTQSRTATNETALSLAARFNNTLAFYYLLKQRTKKQSDFMIQNEKGFNPLHFACSHKNMTLMRYIMNICPKDTVVEENLYGATPLHWLVHGSKKEDIEKLRILHLFCKMLYRKCSHRLVSNMLKIKNALGLTPLDWLELYRHQHSYQFLKRLV